jgi:hypothetical protein
MVPARNEDGLSTCETHPGYSNFKQPTPSLRAQAKQSIERQRKCGLLRRFAPRMTPRYTLAFPRRDASGGFDESFALKTEGVGNAGCPLHPRPRVQSVESTRGSRHRSTGTPGIPARNGFNGLLRALPGDRALLSPSSADQSTNMTPASRRQDHTTSPSAADALVRSTAHVHRIPSRVRDDRDTPLMWDETAEIWI